MQESITMAEVGSIVNVSGNRIATPFGPPKPGSTPTMMPRTRPTIMSESVFQVSRTAQSCRRIGRACTGGHIPHLRPIPGPSLPAAPMAETQKKRQDEQQQVYDHLDLASGRHRRGFVARCSWVVDDDFAIGFQHGDFH